jgi:hypothetical protein
MVAAVASVGNSAALAILPPSEYTLFLLALGELRSPGVGLV